MGICRLASWLPIMILFTKNKFLALSISVKVLFEVPIEYWYLDELVQA